MWTKEYGPDEIFRRNVDPLFGSTKLEPVPGTLVLGVNVSWQDGNNHISMGYIKSVRRDVYSETIKLEFFSFLFWILSFS